MRKSRCTKCGTTFYTADPKVKICQDCSGDTPDKTKQLAQEAEHRRQITNAVKSDDKQTVDITELTDGDGDTDKPKKTRKRRQSVKKEVLNDASTG